ncbi:MAG: hypothetical protein Q7S39_00685 [Ignavibacteria bacterium]|nr:hypothetical protein [Ignavibacteria bacterium]
MFKILFRIRNIKLLGIIIILFSVSLSAQDTTNQNGEKEKIIKEYQEISGRLMDLQKQALSDLEIAKQAEVFSQNLEAEMVRQDSSIKQKLNRRDEIVDSYEKGGDEVEMLKLQQEFQGITQQLMIHQQKVMENNNEIREEGKNLEEALFEKMKELDPEVPKLVARLETLGNQIRGLEEDRKL